LNTPYIIGIAGPSGAGKSFLSKHLGEELDATFLHLDSYYSDLAHMSLVQRAHQNFDAPESLDSDLLIEHVKQLAKGQGIEKPLYDFTIHSRKRETERVEPRQFIIIEGLFALYWEEIRKLAKTKVYVDLGEEICLERRIERDTKERGRTRESVLEQYATTVLPMAKQYVYPTRAYADIVVTGNDNIQYEVSVVLDHIRSNGTSAQTAGF
jgi:uridine kinase